MSKRRIYFSDGCILEATKGKRKKHIKTTKKYFPEISYCFTVNEAKRKFELYNNKIIAIQFYLNCKDDIISQHDYTIIDYLDDENSVIEILVENDKWNEIQIEAKDHKGFYHTYEIESLEHFKDGKETKFFVKIWNPIN